MIQLFFLPSYFKFNEILINSLDSTEQSNSFEDNLDLIGQWDQNYGRAEDLVIKDNYAFIAAEGLVILDISNPIEPTFIGQYKDNETSQTHGVDVQGDLAFIVGYRKGLRIIDISDKRNPILLGNYGESGNGVVVSGEYAYIFDGYDAFEIIDITNTSNPNRVGFISNFNCSPLDALHIHGNFAFIASSCGIEVIDISNPTHPESIKKYDTIYAKDLAVVNDIVFVAGGYEGLTIHNFSDPTNPQQISSLNFGYTTFEISFLENVVYLSNEQNGLTIVDVTDVFNPTVIPNSLSFLSNGILEAFDDRLYMVTEENKLLINAIINPYTLSPLSVFYIGGMALDIAIKDDYVYLANFLDGIVVFDVSDVNNPSLISRVSIGNRTKRLFINDHYLYVIVEYSGRGSYKQKIVVLDISNPFLPQIENEFGDYWFLYDIQFKDSIMFVTSGYSLEIFDISDPINPILMNKFEEFSSSISMKIVDNLLYLGTSAGLAILEFKSDFSISLVDCLFNITTVFEISIDENLGSLFIWNRRAGDFQILLIDISDTRNPLNESYFTINDFDFDGLILVYGGRMIIENGLIYFCTIERFVILKITNDNELKQIGQYTINKSTQVELNKKEIFLSATYDGLLVLQNRFTRKLGGNIMLLLLPVMLIIPIENKRKKKRKT